MELQKDNVIVCANGKVGVIDEVFGKPFIAVFKSFTSPIGRWGEQGEHKNPNYNIVKVLDGSKLAGTNPNANIYRSSFDLSQLETIWEAKQ